MNNFKNSTKCIICKSIHFVFGDLNNYNLPLQVSNVFPVF